MVDGKGNGYKATPYNELTRAEFGLEVALEIVREMRRYSGGKGWDESLGRVIELVVDAKRRVVRALGWVEESVDDESDD